MATKYTFVFTDTTKTGFDVQSYTANGLKIPSDGSVLMVGAAGADTSLKLYGKGLPDYGEGVLQNQIYMLENFANSTKPEFSIEGQTWYNTAGSPPRPELFIRNSNVDDTYGGSPFVAVGWDAIILATGTSAMTGELVLAGNATLPNHAIPLSYLTAHENEGSPALGVHHITDLQNTFMDALVLSGSPALQAADVNQLIGVTGNVQTQLDNKLSLDGGTMTAGLSPAANITFVGGEVLGLPAVPTVDDAAASKKYVDDQNSVGTGELTAVAFVSPPAPGSPVAIVDTDLTSALFTITSPSTTYNLQLDDISRVGHIHPATEISLDSTFNPLYPTNVQGAFEYVDSVISLLTGDTPIAEESIVTVGRKFDVLAADILVGSPIAPYEVLSHFADDNTMSITINGIKQYSHARGYQNIIFDTNVISVDAATPTYLDESLDYDFNININGGGATLITILAGTSISTHGLLQVAINAELQPGSPPVGDAAYVIGPADSDYTRFNSTAAGSATSISITNPSTGGGTIFLFDVDASPDTITGATFLSEIAQVAGSPPGSPVSTPDSIEILGDVTASFTVGTVFSIRGSLEPTYNSYDGAYSVHVNGAVAGGSPLTTTIPIALASDPSTNTPLVPGYVSGLSPDTPPTPVPYGSVYITPILGMDSIASAVAGVEGDYAETDASGTPLDAGTETTHVVFNYDIPTGSKIETLKYT